MSLTQRLKTRASELGFNRVGVIGAETSPTLDAYLAWIGGGMHGEMRYLARDDRVTRRRDLNVIVPGVRTLIIVALDYTTLQPPSELLDDPLRGRISNYAWGLDYHDVMLPRLKELAVWLRHQIGVEVTHRAYVDTGAILERSHAQRAGLGFIGKNTMLIHPRRGSYFFLGEILTTAKLDRDEPHAETMCGTCARCLRACPTDAFPRPYVLDARRCISYLTIELKGSIPVELRHLMGNWLYGCDVCQEVCPWNRFAVRTIETDFFPTDWDIVAPPLMDILSLTEATFQERFAGSPIQRIKRERLVRNACVAAGNSGQSVFIPVLAELEKHDLSALVREHAGWALGRLS